MTSRFTAVGCVHCDSNWCGAPDRLSFMIEIMLHEFARELFHAGLWPLVRPDSPGVGPCLPVQREDGSLALYARLRCPVGATGAFRVC